MSPFEALTGAIFEEVAAPAVRPPRRGRRSRNARCRRWELWHARVSRNLVSLMPNIRFEVDAYSKLHSFFLENLNTTVININQQISAVNKKIIGQITGTNNVNLP